MKLFFSIILISFSIGVNYSQKNIENKTASDMFLEGMLLNYSKEYEEAIEVYQKVSLNDTNYSEAQVEIANCYFYKEDYKSAEKTLNELLELNLPYPKKHIAYKLLGLSYEKDGQFENAIKTYNKGIELFPFHYGLYSNRGYSYENAKKHEKAIEDYKQAILFHPNFAGAHNQLGIYAAKEGYYTEAFLSLMTLILLEPDSERSQKALIILEQIADLSYEEKGSNIDWIINQDNFDKLNAAIKNKNSLAASEKQKFTINNELAKQVFYILSNLNYDKNNNGFWHQFYVPFYKEIFNNGKIDDLILFLNRPSIDPVISKKVAKKLKKTDEFIDWAQIKWTDKIQYQLMNFENKKEHVLVSYGSTGIEGYGKYNESNEPIGKWYYFHPNGTLNLTAEFTNESKKTGSWTWRNIYNGNPESKVEFKDDIATGDAYYYFYTGELSEKKFFKNDLQEDTVYSYFRSGDLFEKYVLKADKKNGELISYYENGRIHFRYSLVDDIAQGVYKSYHANGKLEDEFTLKDDKIEGVRTQYYPNGQKQSEVTYLNDLYNGTLKTWHSNGKLYEEKNYKEGNQVGKFAEYYSNGILSYSGELDETGKQNGTSINYDLDGKKYQEQVYKKGELIEVRSINKKGEVFNKCVKKGKNIEFKSFYPDNSISSEGLFVNDFKDGKWQYYDRYGNIETIEYYANGMLTDTSYSYFANGSLKTKSIYVDDVREGMFLEYNIFDTLIQEGIYSNNQLDRDWYTYNSDGNLTGEYYYIYGDEQGIQKTYGVNGKLTSWKEIELGKTVSQIYLDTNENKIDQFGQFHGEVSLHDPLMKYIRFKGNFKNGYADGVSTWYYPNGKVLSSGFYVNDEKNNKWTWYSENGSIQKEINYLNGLEDGEYKVYYDNGKISYEANYFGGRIQGVTKNYFSNGAISIESNFVDDEKHGKSTYYDQFGNIIMIRYYDNGVFVSYSYLDKNGVEVTPIKLTTGNNLIITYFKNGNKASEHNRKNGLIEGQFILYNINGKIISDIMHKKGTYYGPYKEYNENGIIEYEAEYKADELHGKLKMFYPNGILKKESNYLYDEQHGLSLEYSIDGKLIKSETYYNNDIIDVKKSK